MVIWEDTRQKAGKHDQKHAWWDAHGVAWERRKLDTADYTVDGSDVLIDTKKGLDELAKDLGHDYSRFIREAERAKADGKRIVILIEDTFSACDAGCARVVDSWVNPACRRCFERLRGACDMESCAKFRFRPMRAATLKKRMASMQRNHGCEFMMERPASTALAICDLLGVPYE